MASIVLAGNTSGSITISSPSVSGSNTLTLPANTGTVITTASTFAGTGPAFSAYQSSSQNFNQATWTKIQFQTENFDTNNCFDSTTNYRFTPTVAGYYQVTGSVGQNFSTTGPTNSQVGIYKNGSLYAQNGLDTTYSASTVRLYWNGQGVSSLIYMNGSTDYIELYTYQNGGSGASTTANSTFTYFSAVMVRSA
jgi:hypothetical protein